MNGETIIRRYTRRLLCERGHEEPVVEAFLESVVWQEFYYWVGVGYVEASEAEFIQELGDSLEERFLIWRGRSKRAVSLSSWPPVLSNSDGSSAWKTVLVPIPLEWLPKMQQREVERYIQYLRNRLRSEIERFLRILDHILGRNTNITSMLREMATSSCVKVYPYTRNLCPSWQAQPESKYRAVLKYTESLGYEFVDSAPNAEFFVRVAHLYPSCFSESHALSGFLTECRGFIQQAPTQQQVTEYCSGAVYLLTESACGVCDACKVMVELTNLFQTVWRTVRFWTLAEVFEAVLQSTPLPSRVGYALFRSPFSMTYFSGIQNLQSRGGKLRKLVPEVNLPYSGEWDLKLLPCLAVKSVAAIYKRLAPKLEARSWALRLHASRAIWNAATESKQDRAITPKWDARLRAGTIDKLLLEWNHLTPPEWRYMTPSMREDFRRALLRARRVIDG